MNRGTVLISQSPGREEKCRVANLIVTEERMGRARFLADIRSGAVEAGTWCSCIGTWLFRKVPERWKSRSRSVLNRKRMKTTRVVAPPVAPDGGRMADGLMPLPGEQSVPASADQERFRERRKYSGSWKAFRTGWKNRGAGLSPENRWKGDRMRRYPQCFPGREGTLEDEAGYWEFKYQFL